MGRGLHEPRVRLPQVGSRTALPVLLDLTAVEHPRLYVNGGRRGLILGLEQDDLIAAAEAELVDVGLEG